jgi:ribonuclease MRP protein subunit SNM1
MAAPELSARLRYLNESAHLLATTAPETSRHLMSKHNSLMFDNNLDPTESQRRKACGACGTIMVSGWQGKVEVDSQGARRGKRRPSVQASKKPSVVYTCNSCSRKTRFLLNSSSKPARHKAVPSQLISSSIGKVASTAPITDVNPTTSTANSSSKKRAQSRKKSGLGAILAKQRTSQSAGTGFGLDLMDFMKKPG